MKKILSFLLMAALALGAVCVVAYFAAPVAAALILLAHGLVLTGRTLGLPGWLPVLAFLSLLPTVVVLAVRALSAKSRRLAVIIFITLAVVSALAAAIANKQGATAAHNAAAATHKFLFPLKPADPLTEAWFLSDGRPRLYFRPSGTNTMMFFANAYPGAHDPVTGEELQPVTSLIRQEWQAGQARKLEAETALREQAKRLELEFQQRQLTKTEDALRAERTARLREQEVFISRLLKQVKDKSKELKAAETNLVDLPPSVAAAHQSFADVAALLMTARTNGTPLDTVAAQMTVDEVIAGADLAQAKIQAARADQQKVKKAALEAATAKAALEAQVQQTAAELQKLKDERRQSELAAQNAAKQKALDDAAAKSSLDQELQNVKEKIRQSELAAQKAATENRPRQPDSVPMQSQTAPRQSWGNSHNRSSQREDAVVDLWIENRSQYRVCFGFSSPEYRHRWPEFGRSYIVWPGQTVRVGLSGSAGEPVYFCAWSPDNPFVQWGNRDFGLEDQPPVATCGGSASTRVVIQ